MSKQLKSEFDIPYLEDVYARLEEYLNSIEDENQREKLYNAIKSYFFHPKDKNLHQFFDCGKKDSLTPNRNRLERIRQLYLGFGIPWQAFHKDLKKEHFITDLGPEISNRKVFERLSFHGKRYEETNEFAARYVGALGPYIKETQKMIWVYEYLGKGRTHSPGTALPYYAKAHKIVFEMYERQLQTHPDLEYIRLLALPLPDFSPTPELDSEAFIQQKAGEALIECSLETYEHICNCFKLYERQTKFFIVRRPPQIYHYAIYDDSYTISEYYRYKSNGDFLPDLLFVEKVAKEETDSSRKLYNVYFEEIKELIDIKGRPFRTQEIKKNDFIKASQLGKQQISDRIERISSLPESETKDIELDTWESKKKTMDLKIKTLGKFFSDES